MRDRGLATETLPGKDPSFFEQFLKIGPSRNHEIVILNTDEGFIPSTIRLVKGQSYVIHVVNINDKNKNISFVLNAFSEHHATFYGRQKSFKIQPQKEGVYSYQCPETSVEGRVVVISDESDRMPASKD